MPYQCTDDTSPTADTFYNWLSGTDNPWNGNDSPEGDFTDEYLADPGAPTVVNDFDSLYSYLNSKDACQEAHQAAESVWNSYLEYKSLTEVTRIRGTYQPA